MTSEAQTPAQQSASHAALLPDVPRAPPSQLADVARAPSPSPPSAVLEASPDLDYHKVVLAPQEPRVVRPLPVMARALQGSEPAPVPSDARATSRASDKAPPPPSPLVAPTARPDAPRPWQQVSPLIQASLHARNEFKKAYRQPRPKTFTVLSSSSGQFERDKPHLLTGQKVSPQQALSIHTKRRTTSATKLSSLIAAQEDVRPTDDARPRPLSALHGETIAPTPSYIGRERGVLPAWLREQYEEGNVLYPPPDPTDASVASVYEALDRKACPTMSGSERAAASINRNTPFFPPHERDRERAERATLDGSVVDEYRKLNEATSVGKRSSLESMRTERSKLDRKRSKGTLSARGRRADQPQQTAPQTPGQQLWEAGTYAGFKSMPSTRDLRMQVAPRLSTKRSLTYRPPQEFQPFLAPGAPGDTTAESVDAHDAPDDGDRSAGDALAQGTTLSRAESMPRLGAQKPSLSRSQSQPLRQAPDAQRSVPLDTLAKGGRKHPHERKASGSFTYTPLARSASQRLASTRDDSAPLAPGEGSPRWSFDGGRPETQRESETPLVRPSRRRANRHHKAKDATSGSHTPRRQVSSDADPALRSPAPSAATRLARTDDAAAPSGVHEAPANEEPNASDTPDTSNTPAASDTPAPSDTPATSDTPAADGADAPATAGQASDAPHTSDTTAQDKDLSHPSSHAPTAPAAGAEAAEGTTSDAPAVDNAAPLAAASTDSVPHDAPDTTGSATPRAASTADSVPAPPPKDAAPSPTAPETA